MKALIILISTLSIVSSMKIYSQVSISPEIGMNYRPYTLEGINSKFYHKNPEPYFNVLGEVYFGLNLSMQARAGYVFRKNTKITTDLTFNQDFKGSTFINRELTVNIDMVYRLFNNFKLGAGAGIIHKLNSQVLVDYTSYKNYYNIEPKLLGSFSALIAYNFGKFELNLRYFYLLKNELKKGSYLRIQGGNYGLSCGVSYRLFSSKKK